MSTPFIISIDGPSASGKGTIARLLAERLGLRHIDTGLMYRAVARYLLDNDLPLDDSAIAVDAARNLDFGSLQKSELSSDIIAVAAAQVSVLPDLRSVMLEVQRSLASELPGAVIDGRDIGTVVFPDANVKFFITASVESRAQRRYDEHLKNGDNSVTYEQVLSDMEARDSRDKSRSVSPLKKSENSHLCDTTKMGIETAFRSVLDIVLEHDGVPTT